MAQTYLLFRPARLPLRAGELASSTVLNLEDTPQLRAELEQAFVGLSWQSPHGGSANVLGNWYEISLPQSPQHTLSLRCSLRSYHSALVQQLCDQLGWLAFDERSMCYQPNHAPIPA